MVIFSETLKADAVIFDFDGVIVDTEPMHYKAFQRILEPLGLGFSWEAYVETYMGFDDRDAFMEAFSSDGRHLEHSELNRLVALKAIVFQEVIRDGVIAYPGVVELIKKLYSNGVPLAICSGALLSDITPILEMLDISSCFEIIITADDVFKSKPDPECYRLAYDKVQKRWPDLVKSPAMAIAIEDTPAGISAASSAQLQTVAVTNSYPAEQLKMASFMVQSLAELYNFQIGQ